MKKLVVTLLGVVLLALGVVTFVDRGGLYPVQAQETQTQDAEQETQAQDPIDQLDEVEANLAYEENTIQVVETYGPSVVAVNVSVQGQRMNPFEDNPEFDQLPDELRRFLTPPEPEGDQAPRSRARAAVSWQTKRVTSSPTTT